MASVILGWRRTSASRAAASRDAASLSSASLACFFLYASEVPLGARFRTLPSGGIGSEV